MPYEQLKISTESPVLSWADHALGSEETKMLPLCHLSRAVYVHPDYVLQGVGKLLLEAVEKEAVSQHTEKL